MAAYTKLGALAAVAVALLLIIGIAGASADTTIRVSERTDGTQGNGNSVKPAIDPNGRFVVFESAASNLVVGDTNGHYDIFVHDRDTDNDGVFDEPGAVSTTRVSLDSNGEDANGDSYHPSVSSTGRYVAFESGASDLIGNDINGFEDIFVRDRDTDNDGIFDEPEAVSTIRVSVTNNGLANSNSYHPDMTDDGRFVAFESGIHDPDDTNGVPDIYVRDRDTDVDAVFDELGAVSTIRVSVKTNGSQASGPSYDPAISSDDGKAVAFRSMAPDLVDGDTNTCSGYPTLGTCPDIFIRDRDTDNDQIFDELGEVTTTRVSVSTSGTQGNDASWSPAIGPGGFRVAFDSAASNLVDGDTNGASDVFVNDFAAETTRVSVDSYGNQGNAASYDPAISWDGSYIAFDSWANNLVPGDTNNKQDIFLRLRSQCNTWLIENASAGSTSITVDDPTGCEMEDYILINQGEATEECHQISDLGENTLYLLEELAYDHYGTEEAGEPVIEVAGCPPYPPAGTEHMWVELTFDSIDLDRTPHDCVLETHVDGPISFAGDGLFARSDPYLSEGKWTVDTEILSMNLVGRVLGYEVTLRAGDQSGPPVLPESTGKIKEQTADSGGFPADSFFDVTFEVTTADPALDVMRNCDAGGPVHFEGVTNAIPAANVAYTVSGALINACEEGTCPPGAGPLGGGAAPMSPAWAWSGGSGSGGSGSGSALVVGGIAEWPDTAAGPDSSLGSPSDSAFNYTVLGGAFAATAAAVALAAGAWLFVRRRWLT